jgi:hypothetical protein
VEIVPPAHGDLTKWTQSGVLLLNRVLTVAPGLSAAHKGKGWEPFTDYARLYKLPKSTLTYLGPKYDATTPADALIPATSPSTTWYILDDLCIEMTDSDTFHIAACDTLWIAPGKTLIIRAASEAWPMLHVRPSDHHHCHAPWHVMILARLITYGTLRGAIVAGGQVWTSR